MYSNSSVHSIVVFKPVVELELWLLLGSHYNFWGPGHLASMGVFQYKITKIIILFYNCFGIRVK